MKSKNPIIISGKSLLDRIDFSSFDFFLKKNPSVLNYTIHTKSNEESLRYLNFNSYSNKDLKVTNNLVLLNLEDSLDLRQVLFNSKKNSINFASHNSKIMDYVSSTVSVLVPQETGGLYLNLEQRPQFVMPLEIRKSWGVISFESFFKTIREILCINSKITKEFINSRDVLENIFNEIVLNSKLFEPSSLWFNFVIDKNIQFKYNLYPFKLIIEDYLRTDNFTKHSNILLNRSREVRKLSDTFIK